MIRGQYFYISLGLGGFVSFVLLKLEIIKMKKINILLVVTLIITSISFIRCSNEIDREFVPVDDLDLDELSFTHSMKGWELYSWPNGNDWNYSILIGTNRLKTYDEVTTNKIIVFGKESLKMVLDKLPEGEYISWIGKEWLDRIWRTNYGNLSLPDNNTINEVKNHCVQKKLVLDVID